ILLNQIDLCRTATGGDEALDILLSVRENPIQSSRVLATTCDVCHQSLRPYKLQLVHELSEDDFDKRAEFCEGMIERCNNNNNLRRKPFLHPQEISSFQIKLHSTTGVWSNQNYHWFQIAYTENPQKVNIWAGIIGGRIVGPFFIDGN
ncbi:hypothetical protein NQ318_012575, partial [Aromia moschata]